MLIVRRKAPVSGVFLFFILGCRYMVKSSCFWFEFFAFLFGWFLPCSLMLRAPLLTFLVWFCFVRVGLVGFCFACFS